MKEANLLNKKELLNWLNERSGVTAYDNLRMVVEYGKFDILPEKSDERKDCQDEHR